MKVESFFPGRIRVSSACFRVPATAEKVKTRAEAVPGVRRVSINPNTGSLTIEYDSRVVPMETILAAKRDLELLEQGHSPE